MPASDPWLILGGLETIAGPIRKPDSGWLAGRKVLDFSTGVPRHADIPTAISNNNNTEGDET